MDWKSEMAILMQD